MKFNVNQAHQVEQEILNKKQEISELQKALSDSHLAIYDEKNTVSSLRLQYEDLVKTEKADQRRIRELQALQNDIATKPVFGGGPVNFKDCRPERSKKHFPLKGKEKAMKMGIENQSRQSNMSNVSTLDATGTA